MGPAIHEPMDLLDKWMITCMENERLVPGSGSRGQLCKEGGDEVQTELLIVGKLWGIGFELDSGAINADETKGPS